MTDIENRFAAVLPGPIDSDGEPIAVEDAAEVSVSDLATLNWDGDGGWQGGHDAEARRHNNTRLAGLALQALKTYAEVWGGLLSEPAEQQMRDLLSNLMHLADALGVEFEYLVSQARENYDAETRASR